MLTTTETTTTLTSTTTKPAPTPPPGAPCASFVNCGQCLNDALTLKMCKWCARGVDDGVCSDPSFMCPFVFGLIVNDANNCPTSAPTPAATPGLQENNIKDDICMCVFVVFGFHV